MNISRASGQGDEKLVQLRERLGHPTLHPGDGSVESFLRGIEFLHDQERLAAFSSKVTVVTAPSSLSSFVQTRRECGVTSMYLPKNAMAFEPSRPNSKRYLPRHEHPPRRKAGTRLSTSAPTKA